MTEIEFLRWLVAGFAGGIALLLALTLLALAIARDTLRHMPRVTILDANDGAADRFVSYPVRPDGYVGTIDPADGAVSPDPLHRGDLRTAHFGSDRVVRR